MGKGNSTVTNVQALPAAVEKSLVDAYTMYDPYGSAIGAASEFDPQAFAGNRTAQLQQGELNAINAANSALNTTPGFVGDAQNALSGLISGGIDASALQNQYDLGNLTSGNVNTLPLQNMMGQRADLTGLQNAAGATTDASGILNAANQNISPEAIFNAANAGTDISGILAAGNRTADTSGVTNAAGQQNAATGLLTGMAGQSTNPFLQTQLNNAISGAVNNATSQYALGGRLGSNSFAGALGSGITNAAAPILSQNLQADQARQLQAAQALGSVSGQDIGRQLTAAEVGVNAQQNDINRALQAATSGAGVQQTDLARALSGAGMGTDVQSQNVARQLQGATGAADLQQSDLARALSGQGQLVDANNTGIARDTQLAGLLSGFSEGDVNRALQAQTDSRNLDATLANQLANVSQATNQGNLSAIGMAPGLLGADQSIINQALQANALQRGVQQAGIDGQMAQVNEQNVLDQNQLNALLAASGMGGGLFGNTTTESVNKGALSQATEAATAAAAIASLFGSDKRLKTNIKQTGLHPNGLKTYSWDWNDIGHSVGFSDMPTTGFMAQEVQKLYPQHVYTHDSGYLMLDYGSLNSETKEAA